MAQVAKEIECPYCEEPQESRGLYAHVMNSSDEIHGEHGEVPDDFEERRQGLYRREGGKEKNYLCHHCGSIVEGYSGLHNHLSQSANDEHHPADATPDDGNYTEIPLDEEGNMKVDYDELIQLQSEVIADMQDLQLHDGEELEPTMIDEDEIRDKIRSAVIPYNARKVEQVAALLNQVPELYDRPEIVQGTIDCSLTTFYEGRKLYENGIEIGEVVNVTSSSEGPDSGYKVESHEDGFKVDGEVMVPLSEVRDLAKFVSEAGNRSARLVHKYSK